MIDITCSYITALSTAARIITRVLPINVYILKGKKIFIFCKKRENNGSISKNHSEQLNLQIFNEFKIKYDNITNRKLINSFFRI